MSSPSDNLFSIQTSGIPVIPADKCDPNDAGLVSLKLSKMTDCEKLEFIKNVWKPPINFQFRQHVKNGRKWRFNHTYICPDSPKFYSWLVYSAYYDGVFCLPCLVFGRSLKESRLQKLFTEPLTRWNGASKKFSDHQNKSQTHRDSTSAMHTFMEQMKGTQQPISNIISNNRRDRIQANRTKLIPIIKTVILCGRQNIPLRDHRDDQQYLKDVNNNSGNFQSLLDFRIDSGDTVLENHFKTAPKNATYRSKTIQNEIINCCGKYILNSITEEICKVGFFSIIADEVSDCSQTEQLSISLRFVDSVSQIREEFVGFVKCKSTSAENLCHQISSYISDLSLDMNNVRGQCYDGAANMAGARSGVSARILEKYPKAL